MAERRDDNLNRKKKRNINNLWSNIRHQSNETNQLVDDPGAGKSTAVFVIQHLWINLTWQISRERERKKRKEMRVNTSADDEGFGVSNTIMETCFAVTGLEFFRHKSDRPLKSWSCPCPWTSAVCAAVVMKWSVSARLPTRYDYVYETSVYERTLLIFAYFVQLITEFLSLQ